MWRVYSINQSTMFSCLANIIVLSWAPFFLLSSSIFAWNVEYKAMFLSKYCTQIFCLSGLRSITKVSWSKFSVVKMSFFVALEAVVARTMEGTWFEIREFISAKFPYHTLNGRDVCFDLEKPHWLIQLSFINRNCRQPSFGNAHLRAASSILLNLASFLATRTDKWTNHFPLVLGLPLIVRREEQLLIVPVTSNSWSDWLPFSLLLNAEMSPYNLVSGYFMIVYVRFKTRLEQD